MADMTREELLAYFNEHVFYELLMLRYSYRKLKTPIDQMLWNALFATFNLGARNLYNFLSNKEDNTDVRLCDYVEYTSYRRDNISDITGTLQMINAQCLHLGKKRVPVANAKITLERITVIYEWLEREMEKLVLSFEATFRECLSPERAEPNNAVPVRVLGPTGAFSTTNHTTSVNFSIYPAIGPTGPQE